VECAGGVPVSAFTLELLWPFDAQAFRVGLHRGDSVSMFKSAAKVYQHVPDFLPPEIEN